MQFPILVYKLGGPFHFEKGTYDQKVAVDQQQLTHLWEDGWTHEYKEMVSGNVVPRNAEVTKETVAIKRGRKSKELAESTGDILYHPQPYISQHVAISASDETEPKEVNNELDKTSAD